MTPVTQQAHNLIRTHWNSQTCQWGQSLEPDDQSLSYLIDATAGNGHDTLFLATLAGRKGRVFAFDIQRQAILQTRQLLQEHDVSYLVRTADQERVGFDVFDQPVTLIQADHAVMLDQIPTVVHGRVEVIMFNLGYLPGGDKSCITQTASTLAALNTALQLLSPTGLLSVIAYPGHPGGFEETATVEDWFRSQQSVGQGTHILSASARDSTGPRLLALQRRLPDGEIHRTPMTDGGSTVV